MCIKVKGKSNRINDKNNYYRQICLFSNRFHAKTNWIQLKGGGIYWYPPPKKKLFGHQQNLTIPVNLIFNPNHEKLPKFSESNIKIMKRTQLICWGQKLECEFKLFFFGTFVWNKVVFCVCFAGLGLEIEILRVNDQIRPARVFSFRGVQTLQAYIRHATNTEQSTAHERGPQEHRHLLALVAIQQRAAGSHSSPQPGQESTRVAQIQVNIATLLFL